MRKITMVLCLVLMSTFACFGLTGCGGGAGNTVTTVSQQTPEENALKHVNIYIANDWQNVTLAKNADGSLKEIISGNTTVYPEDVREIVATSWKLGMKEASYAYGDYDEKEGADLPNTVNNDEVTYYVHTFSGKYYQIRVWDAEVWADEEMTDLIYWAEDPTTLRYQNNDLGLLSMSMKMVQDGQNIKLHVECGGNQFLGLPKVAPADEIASLQFISTLPGDTAMYPTIMNVDALGNKSFDISMNQYVKGYLKVNLKDGTWVKPRFYSQMSDSYNEDIVAWWIEGSYSNNSYTFDITQPDADGVFMIIAQ